MGVFVSTSCQADGCERTALGGATIIMVRQPDESVRWLCAEEHFAGVPDEAVAVEVRAGADRVAAAVVAALAAFGAAVKPLQAALTRFVEELDAAGIDPADLVAAAALPPEHICDCLCPKHREDGMNCAGTTVLADTMAVWLVGGQVELGRPVAMCGWCADWWRRKRPDRVAFVESYGDWLAGKLQRLSAAAVVGEQPGG